MLARQPVAARPSTAASSIQEATRPAPAAAFASEYGKSHAPLPLVLVVGGPRLCPGGWPRGEAGECNYKGLSLESYLAAFPDARRLPPQEDAPA